MKITSMECFFVLPRWNFLKITTDEGIVGWGEPVVESRAQTVAKAVEELSRVLIGEDPLRIEHLFQTMYRTTFYRGGPVLTSAISGIEQALWDIKGKYYGMPVYEMLGGKVRDHIRMYSHCGGKDAEEFAANAKRRMAQGFTAVKTAMTGPVEMIDSFAFVDRFATRFAAARELVGKELDIAVDFHGQVSPAMSVRICKAIEPYYPMFVEEPVLPENVDALATVARSTTIPIATGERLFTRYAFREVLEKQAAAVLQPDTCHAGGIFELRKIAAMAEPYFASIAPHNPLGPISLAACLQVDACTPNFLIQEHPGLENGWDRGEGYLKTPFTIVNGAISVPTGPGLGIEVDEDIVQERAFPGDWDSPRYYHKDGSVADW